MAEPISGHRGHPLRPSHSTVGRSKPRGARAANHAMFFSHLVRREFHRAMILCQGKPQHVAWWLRDNHSCFFSHSSINTPTWLLSQPSATMRTLPRPFLQQHPPHHLRNPSGVKKKFESGPRPSKHSLLSEHVRHGVLLKWFESELSTRCFAKLEGHPRKTLEHDAKNSGLKQSKDNGNGSLSDASQLSKVFFKIESEKHAEKMEKLHRDNKHLTENEEKNPVEFCLSLEKVGIPWMKTLH